MTQNPAENAIVAAWEKTWRTRGDAMAICGIDGVTIRTFAAIQTESREIEEQFADFAPRSVVAVQIGNSERWPALLLALFRRTLIPLPLGRHVENAELAQALATCRAAALVRCENAAWQITRHPTPGTRHFPEPVPDLLKLTSGTTSAPRAVRFRAPQLLADAANICDTMGFGADDLNFGVIPFSHSYGFSNLLTPLLSRGVPLVASEDRLPRAILSGLAQIGATVFPGMPVFFEKLAALENAPALPRLRLCISAGAPLPKRVGERFTEKFGVKIHTFYGASECGGIAYDASDDPHCEDGFVGKPMRGVSITHESENAGPITVRSSAVGDGYFPETDEATLGGGRFIPGDLVRRGGRGMYLAGRASDLINIAGRKLNPLEIEARIAEFPGVRQAVVFGVASALRGEEPVACVAGEGIDSAGVLRHCRAALSQWQVPRDVWIVPEIPADERGKISRLALAERYGVLPRT